MKARLTRIAMILLLAAVSLCGCDKGRILGALQPIAANGYLDLGEGNFQNKHMVRLDGEWKFYWKRLISPSVFEGGNVPAPSSLIKFPGYWIDTTIDGEIPDIHGYATYYLEVDGLDRNENYGMIIPDMSHCYELWVNGRLISTNGVRTNGHYYVRYYSRVAIPAPEASQDVLQRELLGTSGAAKSRFFTETFMELPPRFSCSKCS
jgi:two-component system sensor histidine kinase ChiS